MKSSRMSLFIMMCGLALGMLPGEAAQARVSVHGPHVVVAGPAGNRMVRVRTTPPIVHAPVVVRPLPRTYYQVYRAHLGRPHQVYVQAYVDPYGRYVPAYWTWTY